MTNKENNIKNQNSIIIVNPEKQYEKSKACNCRNKKKSNESS